MKKRKNHDPSNVVYVHRIQADRYICIPVEIRNDLGWADNDQIYVATLGRYVILRRNLDNTPVDVELPSGFLLADIVQLLGKLSDEELLHFLKDLQKLTKYR